MTPIVFDRLLLPRQHFPNQPVSYCKRTNFLTGLIFEWKPAQTLHMESSTGFHPVTQDKTKEWLKILGLGVSVPGHQLDLNLSNNLPFP